MKPAKQRRVSAISLFGPPPDATATELGRRTAAVKAWIESKPGAQGRAFAPRKTSPPLVLIYKVVGKMFAILSIRGAEGVIVKCDPRLVSTLRNRYAGVGHRSHLDRRFWISIRLDADVPLKETKRLVSLSYDLVCATLTAKQRAALGHSAAPEKVAKSDGQ